MKIVVIQNRQPWLRCLATTRTLSCLAAAMLAGLPGVAAPSCPPVSKSGQILPPQSRPYGYSLDDMAAAVANFSISGNDLAYYPTTPFQILYRNDNQQDPTGGNTFVVRPGTFIYVKFFFIDDSAPVIGDWPANKSGAADYIFGRDQIGAHDLEIEVDGRVYSLDNPGYIGGPVPTPSSPDGSAQMIQMGAFLSPLNKGTHYVTLSGTFDGDAFVDYVGIPITLTISYTIIVQ